MPTYELRCAECGDHFERFLMRLLKDADKRCPQCGSDKVEAGLGGGFVARPVSSAGCVPRGGFT